MNNYKILIFIALLSAPWPGLGASYFVDSLWGNDRNSGASPLEAWQTLAKAGRQQLQPGDKLLLRSGDRWLESLRLSGRGEAERPIELATYGMDGPAQISGLEISGDYLSIQHLTIDRNKEKRDAIRIRNARHIKLQHLEVRNGAADGVDIQDSQDIQIRDLLIHHFLAGSFEQQKDAHGIAASNTQRLTIENTEIHHTSGDSFQADPARDSDAMSNDIIIKDSYFWTGPLAEDFNAGWRATAHLPVSQRQYPGENAIDTKVVKNNWENTTRMRLTIDGLRAHGWKADAYITNKAVFNLKEKIDIRLNNIDVYDCEMAFRLRGNRGNAQVSINNAKIYQCEAGIRAEDGLQGLVVKNSVFGVGLKKALISVGTTTRQAQPSWTFQNNVFHGAVPKALRGNNNRSRKSDSL